MGSPQSVRATLILSAFAVAVWAAVSVAWGGQPLAGTLVLTPVFFAVVFFTMRMTNRLTGGLLGRFGRKPTEPAPPTPPSSDRPEHAQRRRRRRRPRGRGRQG